DWRRSQRGSARTACRRESNVPLRRSHSREVHAPSHVEWETSRAMRPPGAALPSQSPRVSAPVVSSEGR
ncbi:hypothetical protein PMAYCL1PPCAC_13297, partial [Pristionchus mayeri]